jgi:hypothetical protein
MRQFFKLNFIRSFVHQNRGEEMFFREQERVSIFCFNHLDRVVHKLFRIEGPCLFSLSPPCIFICSLLAVHRGLVLFHVKRCCLVH